MVEMLGVLAVIGVLSVAGIAGYSIAMRSYRTNEIVNAASMLYVMAMAQNAGNGPTTNVGYTDVGATSNPSGVSTLQYNKDDKTITITFDDPNDCTMALNKLGDKATGTCTAGSATLTVTLGETNTSTTPETPTPETPQQDPCSQCTTDGKGQCDGTDCSGCLVPNEHYEISGKPCVSTSTCLKVCDGICFDNDDSDFMACCYGPAGGTCSNYV